MQIYVPLGVVLGLGIRLTGQLEHQSVMRLRGENCLPDRQSDRVMHASVKHGVSCLFTDITGSVLYSKGRKAWEEV